MTVNSENNKTTYSGDGATVSFSTGFTFASNGELTVTLVTDSTGAETPWTDGTQYTLTGAGTGSNGTLTVDTSPTDYTPASGETLVIELEPDFTQTTSLPRGGTVSPKDTLEPMHDKRVRQLLRLKDQTDLSLKAPIAETSIGTLPQLANRKGYLLGFDPTTGDPVVSSQTTAAIEAGSTAAAASAAAALVSENAAAASETNAAASATAAAASGGILMAWETTTTDTDQGVGKVWTNNANPASATVLYMDDVEAASASINSWVDSWDDSTHTISGTVTIYTNTDPAIFAVYDVTGAVTSASTYSKIAVTYVTGAGTFIDAAPVSVMFIRSGDNGAGDMLAANNLSDVAVAATARTNLGLAIGTDVQAYDADTAKLDVAQVFTASQRATVTALTSTTNSIAVDFALSNDFSHTFTENTTLANPTNIVAGQAGSIFFTQHASSPKTLGFGTYWYFTADPTITASNSALDRIDYVVRSTTVIDAVATLNLVT